MMTRDARLDLAEDVMRLAGRAGAQACSVAISSRRAVEVAFREGQLDRLQESLARSLTLELFLDGRYSVHATQKLDHTSLEAFVGDAAALTRFLAPDPHRCLPEPELSRLHPHGELQLVDPAHDALETPTRIAWAREAEEAAREAAGAARLSTSTSWYDVHAQLSLLNSAGFHGEHEATTCSLSASATVRDGDRGRPEEDAYAAACHLADLPQPGALGTEAAERALARIGQAKLPSGCYDVVVENRVAGRLLEGLLEPMTAAALQQKSSWLEGRLGQAVGSTALTLVDDPFLPRGLGSGPFDGEGLALQRRALVEGGLLKAYLVDNHFGRKLGLRPTGGGTSNLCLEGGRGSLEDLLRGVTRGILVQGFIGGNHNGTTGDFSYGITGQLVEDGRPVRPVNEMNLSGTMLDLWTRLEGAAGDPDTSGSWRIPSLRFRGLAFSGS